MQYINVSQFYQSVICFSIPLLLVQRVILFWNGLSTNYHQYRMQFYEDQFKFMGEYEYQQKQKIGKGGGGLREHIVEAGETSRTEKVQRKIDESLQVDAELKNEQNINKQQIEPSSSEYSKQQYEIQPKSPSKTPSLKQQISSQSEPSEYSQKTSIQISQLPDSPLPEPKTESQNLNKSNKSNQNNQQSRMSRVTQSDMETRRGSRYQNQGEGDVKDRRGSSHQASSGTQKIVIQLGRGKLQEQGEQDRIRLKYCRRIDDAFNDYVPIILSVIVIGILTQAVYIYSMCCFFGYAFASLLFNYAHLLDRLQGSYDNTSLFGKANRLISSLFILGLFLSYWISKEFS